MDNGNCDLIAIPAVIGVGTYNDIVTYNNGCGLYSLVYIYILTLHSGHGIAVDWSCLARVFKQYEQ